MRIESIRLVDFCQYRGDQKIVFPSDVSSDIHIIMGGRGTGKTNLLRALRFCLYGDYQLPHREYELLNRTVLASLEIGETARSSVEVRLEQDGQRYQFRREYSVRQQSNGAACHVGELEGKINTDQWTNLVESEYELDEIIPSELRDGLFVDSDSLMEFGNHGKGSQDLIDQIFKAYCEQAVEDANQLKINEQKKHVVRTANDYLEHLSDRVRLSLAGDEVTFRHPGGEQEIYPASGEKILAAISLLLVIGEMYSSTPPQFFDTPLGRLDSHKRDRVLSLLENKVEHQVIITAYRTTFDNLQNYSPQPGSVHYLSPNESYEEVEIEREVE